MESRVTFNGKGYLHWLLMLPCILCLIISAGWPVIRTLYFSFTDANLEDISVHEFIWLENFVNLFQDYEWWESVWNTVIITVGSVSIETILGMILALVLHKNFKGRSFLRVAVLIPWVIPTIVSAQMWAWMLNDIYGVVNAVLIKLGVISSHIPWIASNSLSILSIIIVDVWKTTPYMALLLLAGLQSLPNDCFEAADVDGIPFMTKFFHITLPLMYKTIIVAVLFRTLDAVRIFDLVYMLTSGNHASATMSVYARKHLFDYTDVGYGSAAATVLLFFVALLGVFYISLKTDDGRFKFMFRKKSALSESKKSENQI